MGRSSENRHIFRGGLVELPNLGNASKPIAFIPFMFNPEDIEEVDKQEYSTHKVPMWADPIHQYVGGAGTSIKFSLALEQMRMNELFNLPPNSRERTDVVGLFTPEKQVDPVRTISVVNNEGVSSNLTTSPNFPPDIDQYIKAIERLKYPRRTGEAGQLFVNAPPRVMLVMGRWFRIGFITGTTVKYHEFYSEYNYEGGQVQDGDIRSASLSVDMLLAYGKSAPQSRFVSVNAIGKR